MAESGEHDRTKPSGLVWPLVLYLVLYTAGFAVVLFGTWKGTWLRPSLGVMMCLVSGITFEVLSHAYSQRRIRPVMFAAMLTLWGIPPIVLCEYRLPTCVPYRSAAPWYPSLCLVVAATIFVVLVLRATLKLRALLQTRSG